MGGGKEAYVITLGVSDNRLKGRVIAIEKTGETAPREGETWQKWIFALDVTRFSGRAPN